VIFAGGLGKFCEEAREIRVRRPINGGLPLLPRVDSSRRYLVHYWIGDISARCRNCNGAHAGVANHCSHTARPIRGLWQAGNGH
jgi:hypothetical protein